MPWQESAIRGLDGMPGPAMRAPVRTKGGGGTGARQAPWPARDGASEEEIRRRLPVPQPYYAFKRAARRPGPPEHGSSVGQPGGPLDPGIGEDI